MLTQTWNLINFHFTQLIRIFLINVRYFYFIDFPCILYILPIRNFYCFSIQKFLFSYILLLNLCKQINTSSSVKQVENSIFKTKPLSKIIMYSRLDEPQAELYIRGICKHRKVYQVNKKFIDFIVSEYFTVLWPTLSLLLFCSPPTMWSFSTIFSSHFQLFLFNFQQIMKIFFPSFLMLLLFANFLQR